MSDLVVDVPLRSVIGAKLADEFRRRNLPTLTKYAEDTQKQHAEDTHKQYAHGQYTGGVYRRMARVTSSRRVLKMREMEEPPERVSSLADYESQDDPFTPRIESPAHLGGYDDGYTLPIGADADYASDAEDVDRVDFF
jgi:hypothetical protein